MKKGIMVVDQGTTSSKAFIIDHEGNILGQSGYEFKQIYPRPGWVEHDPIEIWDSLMRACLDVLRKTGIEAFEIEALGITNQRETTVVWERNTGKPLTNAIVWQCRRSSQLCEEVRKTGREDWIREKTGLMADPYFSATKLQWILQNIPGALNRAENGDLCFGTIDSWLLYRFSGGKLHFTDFSNASRTMLYNIHSLHWDQEILNYFGIPDTMLPIVKSSSEIYGRTAPELFGGAAIPISGMIGDQQGALFGQGCFEKGDVKNTYGTGCFLLANIGHVPIESEQKLVTSIGWGLSDRLTYVLEGSVFISGAAVQWLRDELGLVTSSSDIEQLAQKVTDTGGVYFLPAFVGLGAPHWDATVRGIMVGITRGTNAAHIARATLEAMAYQTKDVIECIEKDSEFKIEELKVDGGASENNLLMQFQADILGVPVIRPKNIQTTALGAAYLAGLATGYWRNLDEIRALQTDTRRFLPAMSEEDRRLRFEKWKQLIKIAKLWRE